MIGVTVKHNSQAVQAAQNMHQTDMSTEPHLTDLEAQVNRAYVIHDGICQSHNDLARMIARLYGEGIPLLAQGDEQAARPRPSGVVNELCESMETLENVSKAIAALVAHLGRLA
jgi:hypothetical protein